LVGEDNSRLLGALLITKLQLAAMSRVDIPEEQRNDFYLYVDEFQNFATDSFVNVLSEARKYRLALILANQYIAQLTESNSGGHNTKVRDAVFGNVGTMILFRVGAEDAEFLEREFSPEFEAPDLVNLSKYNIYAKLMINGASSRPFSAQTLMPEPRPAQSFKNEIIDFSRKNYSNAKRTVEESIANVAETSIDSKGQIQQKGPVEIFEDICQICGKKTRITFRPDGKRPVFCPACFKRIGKERLEAQLTSQKRTFNGLAGMSLAEAMQEEPVSFSGKKKEEDSETRGEDKPKKKKKEVRLDDLRSVLKGISDRNKEKEEASPDEVFPGDKAEEEGELGLGSLEPEKKENGGTSIQTNDGQPAKSKIEKIDPGQVVKFN